MNIDLQEARRCWQWVAKYVATRSHTRNSLIALVPAGVDSNYPSFYGKWAEGLMVKEGLKMCLIHTHTSYNTGIYDAVGDVLPVCGQLLTG